LSGNPNEENQTIFTGHIITWSLNEITPQWMDRKIRSGREPNKVLSGPEKVTSLSSLPFTTLDDSAGHHAT
jgi:hypothetical protein